ncbi:MAG: response regulator [Trichocoleus desertorum ATA4-8-CV12]|jgi:PAS domain S-box-containing protein|nr:response regulator [Trichocoleus desertorum ATA4-8-CV12]
MQRQTSEIVTLNDILITEELSQRPSRSPNWQAENRAMRTLAQEMTHNSASLQQTLVEIALELCQAGTAGVSLLETTATGEEVFRWTALAGTLAKSVGDTTPRDFSPCGVCLDRGTPQLFGYPERYFTYLQDANTPFSAERNSEGIVEGLVLPLIADGHALGTIWIVSHDEQRHFDLEDVRVMSSLADFAATALLLNQRQAQGSRLANSNLTPLEDRYRLALEAAELAAWDWNIITNRVVWNDQHYHLLGLEPDHREQSAEMFIQYVYPADRQQMSERLEQAIATNGTYQADFRIVRADTGEIRWMSGYGRVMETHHGKATRMSGVMSDSTERQQAETNLHESEEKYRSLFNSIDEGYLLIDVIFDEADQPVDLLYVEANQAAIAMVGQDFTGRRLSKINPEYEPFWYEIFGRVARTGESERLERYAQPDQKWYDFYVVKVGDDRDRRVAVVFQDITDRKQNEEALRESKAQIAADLAGIRRLYELQSKLANQNDVRAALQDVLAVACEFTSTDRGCVQLLSSDGKRLEMAVWQGYADDGPFISFFRYEGLETGCEVARVHRQRLIIEDTVGFPGLEGTDAGAASHADGIRAAQSTPMASRSGETIGVISTQFRQPHRPSDHELRLMDMLAWTAGEFLERHRADAALRQSEEKYRSLFESINDGFCLIEMIFDENEQPVDYRFLEISPSFEQQTGMANALGKRMRELAPDHEEFWFETYGNVALTGQAVCFESRAEQLHRWFDIYAFPVGEPENQQVAIVFNDITDRKQAEADQIQRIQEQAAYEEERQRAETLAELDRAKTIFFSNVSHEFRTPLTLMLAPLQDALNEGLRPTEGQRTHPLNSVNRERIELAHRNALRLLKLVNTLLDFSRIEAGRMEAVYEPTDLSQFTTELASVFRSAIEQAGLRLIVDCSPLPEAVYVDREMWEKIILNLLSNAFKFTFEGEITLSIRAESDVVLEVWDTGVGIAPDELPHLFERFYQVRGTQARTHEGSGIGLALVNELVRLHGGTIEVSSTLGQGTCFAIALPFGTDHLPSDRLRPEGDRIQPTRTLASTAIDAALYVETVERWLPGKDESGRMRDETEAALHPTAPQKQAISLIPHSSSHPSGTPKAYIPHPSKSRVLLVDDNADMREYLTRILNEHVQVEAVANGEAALTAAQAHVPDLILSDVMMPGLDGFGLLQALRADPRTREVPIILLSARAGEEAIVEGLEAGADDYLIKPFSAQELVSRVNAHLQMAQLRGEALHQARTTIRRRDELLSTVSHELNTPLVSILGWTRLLRTSPSSPLMLTKALDTIERNATLQAKLVQDLLDISRITTGKLRLHLQPVELATVIETAIATVYHLAEAKGIDLVWWGITDPVKDPVKMAEVMVMGDSDRLQQVICNLLTNAIKFTPESGQVDVQLITHATSQPADYAEIRVTDTGIGIAADFLPHVFDRFRQARDSDSENGLGLGLAIAHHLAELHNGTIHAESAGEGKGTTLIVRLPLLTSMTHEPSSMP